MRMGVRAYLITKLPRCYNRWHDATRRDPGGRPVSPRSDRRAGGTSFICRTRHQDALWCGQPLCRQALGRRSTTRPLSICLPLNIGYGPALDVQLLAVYLFVLNDALASSENCFLAPSYQPTTLPTDWDHGPGAHPRRRPHMTTRHASYETYDTHQLDGPMDFAPFVSVSVDLSSLLPSLRILWPILSEQLKPAERGLLLDSAISSRATTKGFEPPFDPGIS